MLISGCEGLTGKAFNLCSLWLINLIARQQSESDLLLSRKTKQNKIVGVDEKWENLSPVETLLNVLNSLGVKRF